MNKESVAEPNRNLWQDRLYHWSPCRLGVIVCFSAILYSLYGLAIVGGNGGERSIELIAYFVIAAILALIDILIKWLLNPTTMVLWLLELFIIGCLVVLYSY